MKYLVIVPAYNEELSVGRVLTEIAGAVPFADILVVNDGSRDNTASIARERGVMVISHPFNLGYGTALQTGFRYAVQAGYDYIISIDADGQHRPTSVGVMIKALEENHADVVIGSRFIQEGYNAGIARKIGIMLFSYIAKVYTGIRFTDPTSGFQLIGRDVFTYLAKRDNYPLDYPDVNIIMALHKMKFRIIEAPVIMTENKTGKSMHSGLKPIFYVIKMSLAIIMVLVRRAGK